MNQFPLWPAPRQIHLNAGYFKIEEGGFILLDHEKPFQLLFSIEKLNNALSRFLGITWKIIASNSLPEESIHLRIQVLPEVIPQTQGYRMTISPSGISIIGNNHPGVYYAICTLVQLVQVCGKELPCMKINDFPDFPARGVMLDVSRDRVPKMETLYELIDLLSSLKINQFQLYTEHTFAYQNHPVVWEKASPLTAEEIIKLDAYCRERFIELVPNQNSFGHMQRWLKWPEYRSLAEVETGFQTPWGYMEGPFSLNPEDPRSLQLLTELYDELLPHFTSRMFNVGCDETFDLGQGKSMQACSERGAGRVYLDFLLKINHSVRKRGKVMQFWGDIILEHPDLIPEIPSDVIALDWGYEADHPFDKQAEEFSKSGKSFYVCPGTSSWNSLAGRTNNAIENLKNAASQGLRYGAIGYLNTDWGDNGHWQQFPVSFLGYLAGAGYSWTYEASKDSDISEMLDRYMFFDPAREMGKVAFTLGNAYLEYGVKIPNASFLFLALQASRNRIIETFQYAPEKIDRVMDLVAEATEHLDRALPGGIHSNWLREEYAFTAKIIRHSCQKIQCIFDRGNVNDLKMEIEEIIQQFQTLWANRSRPGGLVDSLERFEAIKKDYQNW